MPAKANTDLIRELSQNDAVHAARLDQLWRDRGRLEAVQTKATDAAHELSTRVRLLEEKLADLKKALEEAERKRWALTMMVIGTFLTLLVNIALTSLRK